MLSIIHHYCSVYVINYLPILHRINYQLSTITASHMLSIIHHFCIAYVINYPPFLHRICYQLSTVTASHMLSIIHNYKASISLTWSLLVPTIKIISYISPILSTCTVIVHCKRKKLIGKGWICYSLPARVWLTAT